MTRRHGNGKTAPDSYGGDIRKSDRRGGITISKGLAAAALLFAIPAPAFAMHISEGLLPAPWAILWYAAALPFVAWGLRDLRRRSETAPQFKPLVGLVGAAVFLISCMPIPVPGTGTCSHPCGTGIAAILIGPGLTVVVASIALTLQALFLAHGGLTTLGANVVSMGVAGAYAGYGIWWIGRRMGIPWIAAAFLAGLLSDWATYATTAFELAAALHGGVSLTTMFSLILVAFVPTQLPLGILEGLLCAGTLRFIRNRKPELLRAAAQGGAA
jgi:cobalt/nickel transport system permease protein